MNPSCWRTLSPVQASTRGRTFPTVLSSKAFFGEGAVSTDQGDNNVQGSQMSVCLRREDGYCRSLPTQQVSPVGPSWRGCDPCCPESWLCMRWRCRGPSLMGPHPPVCIPLGVERENPKASLCPPGGRCLGAVNFLPGPAEG